MRIPKIATLRHRAVIRRRSDTPAGDFGVVEAYAELAQCWAGREPVGGATYVGSIQTGDAVTHRIYLRRDPGLALGLDHVVDVDGFRHAVKRVTDLGCQHRFTVLEVQELGPLP